MTENIRISALSDGSFSVTLPESEKEMLISVAAEMLDVVEDTSLKRLYPPAHLDSKKLQKEYISLTQDYLLGSRKKHVREIPMFLGKNKLSESDLDSLIAGVNILRLLFASILESSKVDMFAEISEEDKENINDTLIIFKTLNAITSDFADVLS